MAGSIGCEQEVLKITEYMFGAPVEDDGLFRANILGNGLLIIDGGTVLIKISDFEFATVFDSAMFGY